MKLMEEEKKRKLKRGGEEDEKENMRLRIDGKEKVVGLNVNGKGEGGGNMDKREKIGKEILDEDKRIEKVLWKEIGNGRKGREGEDDEEIWLNDKL